MLKVKQAELSELERVANELGEGDFKSLAHEPAESKLPSKPWYPTLSLPLKKFSALKSENAGNEVMLVVKGRVESISEKSITLEMGAAALIHGKKLSYAERKALPKGEFVFPGQRKYPIPDAAHARNALARVSAHGTPSEKAAVRAAVKSRFPGIDIAGARKKLFGR